MRFRPTSRRRLLANQPRDHLGFPSLGVNLVNSEVDVSGGQWLMALGAAALVAVGLTAAMSWWLLGI